MLMKINMKLIKDSNGYISGILIILLIIPVIMLLIITIDENNHYINQTSENIQDNTLNTLTTDFQNEIKILTKETMSNITRSTIHKKQPLTNSKNTIKQTLQEKINQKEEEYYNKTGCNIDCNINEVKPADNPFKIEVDYTIKSNFKNNCFQRNKKEYIEITDSKYPVYDPLPALKTGTAPVNNTIQYGNNLRNIIHLDNSDAYADAVQGCIIKECPYNDYSEHGHNRTIITSCLKNHYYHESHDGLCIFCRLENKTSCSDMGLETFIIPAVAVDKAPVSIDHVLLNSADSQYSGNNITINDKTVIYLDNGHKSKYNL